MWFGSGIRNTFLITDHFYVFKLTASLAIWGNVFWQKTARDRKSQKCGNVTTISLTQSDIAATNWIEIVLLYAGVRKKLLVIKIKGIEWWWVHNDASWQWRSAWPCTTKLKLSAPHREKPVLKSKKQAVWHTFPYMYPLPTPPPSPDTHTPSLRFLLRPGPLGDSTTWGV